MFTLKHFGNEYTAANCSIGQACRDAGVDVGNNDPYVNGQQASMDTEPNSGSTVTFRPRASGKAA